MLETVASTAYVRLFEFVFVAFLSFSGLVAMVYTLSSSL